MRRRTPLRLRTTKPCASPSAAVAVARTEIASGPGTTAETGAATDTPAGVDCGSTVTAQAPAPSPASSSWTVRETLALGATNPNDRFVGAVNRYGWSAWTASMSPPPSRVTGTSAELFAFTKTGAPVDTSADLICATVQVGCRCRRRAATPATCGDAMLVPLSAPNPAFGREESTSLPGAVTSGFSRSDTGDGPADENQLISGRESFTSAAATLIAFDALPGERIEPRPKSEKSLPAAATGTTPASAAASSAFATRSRR